MQHQYLILIVITINTFLYSADQIAQQSVHYSSLPEQREYPMDGREDQFNRSFSRDTAETRELTPFNYGLFIDKKKKKGFYAEILKFTLMNEGYQ